MDLERERDGLAWLAAVGLEVAAVAAGAAAAHTAVAAAAAAGAGPLGAIRNLRLRGAAPLEDVLTGEAVA